MLCLRFWNEKFEKEYTEYTVKAKLKEYGMLQDCFIKTLITLIIVPKY